MVVVDGSGLAAGEDIALYSDADQLHEQVDAVKAALLFFDGVALAVPDFETEVLADPLIGRPLAERGLLHSFDPSLWMDQRTARAVARTVTELLKSATPDMIYPVPPEGDMYEILTWGWPKLDARHLVMRKFLHELRRRNLMIESDVDATCRMHRDAVGVLVMVLCQALRLRTAAGPVRVHPMSCEHHSLHDVLNILTGERRVFAEPSRWGRGSRSGYVGAPLDEYPRMVTSDFTALECDLSRVPLDELLAFRADHGAEFRAYARGLNEFLLSMGTIRDPHQREAAVTERCEQIAEEAARLRGLARSAFRGRTVAATLTIAGAAWTALHDGDPIGALLGSLAAGAALPRMSQQPVTAYTYLISIRRQWQ